MCRDCGAAPQLQCTGDWVPTTSKVEASELCMQFFDVTVSAQVGQIMETNMNQPPGSSVGCTTEADECPHVLAPGLGSGATGSGEWKQSSQRSRATQAFVISKDFDVLCERIDLSTSFLEQFDDTGLLHTLQAKRASHLEH